MTDQTRRFTVHTVTDARHCREVEGASFEDAALAFVEDWAGHEADGEVSLVVYDREGERELCIRVDLSNGRAAPCV